MLDDLYCWNIHNASDDPKHVLISNLSYELIHWSKCFPKSIKETGERWTYSEKKFWSDEIDLFYTKFYTTNFNIQKD